MVLPFRSLINGDGGSGITASDTRNPPRVEKGTPHVMRRSACSVPSNDPLRAGACARGSFVDGHAAATRRALL